MMEPLWALGCTGEFGCDCPEKQAALATRLQNLRDHGTRKKYQKGCRCVVCTKANTTYTKKYRSRRGTA